MSIYDDVDLARMRAHLERLEPTGAGYWRRLCRDAVVELHIGLAEAEAMDPEHLALHLEERRMEEALESEDTRERVEELILEDARESADPHYSERKKSADIQAAKNIVADDLARQKAGKGIISWLLKQKREQDSPGPAPTPSMAPTIKEFQDTGDPDA